MESTKDRLTRDLANAGAPQWMVDKAEQGIYDDYESPLATPITQLIQDCRDEGLEGFAREAINGKYDGTQDEAAAYLESVNFPDVF